MDKLHKIRLLEILESYRLAMTNIEIFQWNNLALKQDARLSIIQNHLEQLIVLLADQEKVLE